MNKNQRNTIIRRMARAGIPFSVAQTDLTTRYAVEIRQIVIQLLYWFENLTQTEIADFLHTTQASVSRSMKSFNLRRKNIDPNDNFLKKYDDWRVKYKAAIQNTPQ